MTRIMCRRCGLPLVMNLDNEFCFSCRFKLDLEQAKEYTITATHKNSPYHVLPIQQTGIPYICWICGTKFTSKKTMLPARRRCGRCALAYAHRNIVVGTFGGS